MTPRFLKLKLKLEKEQREQNKSSLSRTQLVNILTGIQA